MMSRSTIGLVAGICGGLFIGYCIYFDKKRRSDPNYKKKVLERRRRQKEEEERKNKLVVNFNDPLEMQRVFLQELEQGEELLRLGRFDSLAKRTAGGCLTIHTDLMLTRFLMLPLVPSRNRRHRRRRGAPV